MKLSSVFISLFLSMTVVAASWMSCCASLSALSETVTAPTSYHQVTTTPACDNEPAENIISVTNETKSNQDGQICEGCAYCQFTVIVGSLSFVEALNLPADYTAALLPNIRTRPLHGQVLGKAETPPQYPNVSVVDGRFIETDLYLI